MLDISLVFVTSFTCSSGLTVKQQQVISVGTVTCDSPECGVPRGSSKHFVGIIEYGQVSWKTSSFSEKDNSYNKSSWGQSL